MHTDIEEVPNQTDFYLRVSLRNGGHYDVESFKNKNRVAVKDDKTKTHIVKQRNNWWKIKTTKDVVGAGYDYHDDNVSEQDGRYSNKTAIQLCKTQVSTKYYMQEIFDIGISIDIFHIWN